jgi:hypothetical protein
MFTGLLEPPDGRMLLGAWVDTQVWDRPGVGSDLPVRLNQRLQLNFTSFQLVQDIPVTNRTFFNVTRLDETSTDAILFLVCLDIYSFCENTHSVV